MTTTGTAVEADRTQFDALLRDYHEARRREDQWRIPQLLLALITPIFALFAALTAGGNAGVAAIAAALAVITGTGAALLAVEIWRQHRTAIGIWNHLRTEYPQGGPLLLKDPL